METPLLSILIPSISERKAQLNNLLAELDRQCGGIKDIATYESEEGENIFTHYFHNGVAASVFIDDKVITIGEKRNLLLEIAEGGHLCFCDDDDDIAPNYIDLLLEGVKKDVDCCSLKGIITTDGKDPHYFEHSKKCKEYKTNSNTNFESGDIKYERFNNHLNVLRSSIAKQFKFPEKSWGEDTDFATQIRDSGLLKTEHYINQVIYYYKFINEKK